MQSARLGLLTALALVFVFPQVSNVSVSRKAVKRIVPLHLGRIKDKIDHFDGTASSTNWSGYAVTGTGFTSASGSWIVPTTTCQNVSGVGYAALWVGIDGYNSDTVEQTGTLAECIGRTTIYYAWYEFYPAGLTEITSVPVKPGDVISASVTYASGEFTTTIKDVTTGKSYSKTSAVSGAERTSAEWIAEAPCCTLRGGILPLADFGTAKYGTDSTGVSATNYAAETGMSNAAIGGYTSPDIEEITKVPSSSSPQTSTCSQLSGDGTSFTCSAN